MSSDNNSRRQFLRQTGTVTAAGALGALAGCSGKQGSSGDSGSSGGSNSGSGSGSSSGGSGGSETKTVTFWSFLAAENAAAGKHFQKSMKNFESKNDSVSVKLQSMNSGDLKAKLPAAVQSGNAPDLVEGGTTALPYLFQDKLADHNAYFEEHSKLEKNYTAAQLESAKFRGDFWSGGGNRHLVTMLAVRPKFFKQVGVDDPSQLQTWTDYRRALEKIDKQFGDTHAYEATGVPGDLESYWGEARTAHTEGKDPWIRGDPKDPDVQVGKNGRTDGMMKNIIDMADAYSSAEAASRGDEQLPSLMLTDQVASFTYGLGSPIRYKSVKSDVTFGWDGDVWQGPIPKLDPNYGNEFGISDLAGKEGAHGGHLWALEFMKQVFKQSNVKDAAFDLMTYCNTTKDHNVELLSQDYPAIASYKPVNDAILNEYGSDMPQIQKAIYQMPQKYGSQFNTTGAAWDVKGTNKIRWKDLNEPISQGIAGQIKKEDVPKRSRKRILKTLKNKNN